VFLAISPHSTFFSLHFHFHSHKVEAAKAAAVRGLSNYMFHEAQRLATKKKPSKTG